MNGNRTVEYAAEVAKSLVKNSPLAVELSDDQCSVLAGIIRVAGLKAGEFLLQEGEVDDSLHVLVSGRLEVVRAIRAESM